MMKRIIDFLRKAYDKLLRRKTGRAVLGQNFQGHSAPMMPFGKDSDGKLHINADVVVHGTITSIPNQD